MGMLQVRDLFLEADTDGSGTLCWEEFEEHLDNPKMKRFLKAIDVGSTESWDLFQLLDVEGNGEITIADFVNGALGLFGPARALELATLSNSQSKMNMFLSAHVLSIEEKIDMLCEFKGEDNT